VSVPEHLWRFPTTEARVRLAQLLDLQYHGSMQDWEWEVADPKRIGEFLQLYESNELSENEQFSLMEVIIQSVEDSEAGPSSGEWKRILQLLDERIMLHSYSVWYWAMPDDEDEKTHRRVTRDLRRVLERHRPRLAQQTASRDRTKRGA